MKPCPAEAAATLLDALAAMPAPSLRDRASAAAVLVRVPLVHPMRGPSDRVLDMADAVRTGRPTEREDVTPEAMRAFAEELRAGAPEMRATGWGWLL